VLHKEAWVQSDQTLESREGLQAIDGWMDRWMDPRMDGWIDAWMHGYMDAWIYDWIHDSMDIWMDGWMDE
jgi:hypothetical protein